MTRFAMTILFVLSACRITVTAGEPDRLFIERGVEVIDAIEQKALNNPLDVEYHFLLKHRTSIFGFRDTKIRKTGDDRIEYYSIEGRRSESGRASYFEIKATLNCRLEPQSFTFWVKVINEEGLAGTSQTEMTFRESGVDVVRRQSGGTSEFTAPPPPRPFISSLDILMLLTPDRSRLDSASFFLLDYEAGTAGEIVTDMVEPEDDQPLYAYLLKAEIPGKGLEMIATFGFNGELLSFSRFHPDTGIVAIDKDSMLHYVKRLRLSLYPEH